MAPDRGARAWLLLHREETYAILLARVRTCALASLAGVLLTSLHLVLADPVAIGPRAGFAAAYGTLSVVAWTLTRLLRPHRARLLSLAYVLALTGLMTLNFSLLAIDREAAPASFVAEMLGVTVLLPWGALPQLTVGGAAVAGYLVVADAAAVPLNLSVLTLLVSAIGASVLGAAFVERYRAGLFERTWQQTELVAMARELAQQVEPEEVIERVLERGIALVGGDSAGVSLHDPSRRVYRVEMARGGAGPGSEWMIGLEAPEDYGPAKQIVARGVLELPDDDPESAILPLLAAHGVRRVLYVAMRHGDEVVGIVHFVRAADVPFGESARLLARGLADQAALALRTARLVADLRRANEIKSEFVSTMSHELRTPLNVILGYAEMAQEASATVDEVAGCIAGIETAGRELLSLIESTLEIGRMAAGRDDLRPEPVALDAFWSALGEVCGRLPRRPTVVLEWVPVASVRPFVTDPRKFTVVVRNLVGNALKFTEDGSVRVELASEDDELVLRVVDTGIGISPEDHDAIFEMFRQADGSDSRRYGGTGLGLYIVRRLVEQLGGSITLDSSPRRGSTFTVRLRAATMQSTRRAA